MRFVLISSLLLLLIFSGCSVLTTVRVLEKDHSQINLSVGGPVVPKSLSTVIVPYTTIGYAYGLQNSLSLAGNFHLISAVFKTPGVDIGAVYRILPQENYIPEITIYPKFYFFKGLREDGGFRFFPSASINGSYNLWGKNLFYFGFDYMMQLTKTEYFLTPFLGYEFPLSSRIKMQTELKWMASNADTKHGIFEGENSIGGNGTIGLFIGVNYAL